MTGDFCEEDKTKCLLWCSRHCCLCGKACGTNIEIAHVIPKGQDGSDDIDNAIPLCFDCHSEIGRYNKEHPRGNKYVDLKSLKHAENKFMKNVHAILFLQSISKSLKICPMDRNAVCLTQDLILYIVEIPFL